MGRTYLMVTFIIITAFALCSLVGRTYLKVTLIIAELLARTKRAQSGAPWVRKFGKLSI